MKAGNKEEKKIFFTKSLPERKKRITFAPRESGSSLEVCVGCERKEEIKISEKNFQKGLQESKRISTFAPAS